MVSGNVAWRLGRGWDYRYKLEMRAEASGRDEAAKAGNSDKEEKPETDS